MATELMNTPAADAAPELDAEPSLRDTLDAI